MIMAGSCDQPVETDDNRGELNTLWFDDSVVVNMSYNMYIGQKGCHYSSAKPINLVLSPLLNKVRKYSIVV